MPDNDAIFLDDLIRKLSFGWAFPDEAMLTISQIVARFRNRLVSRSQFLVKHLLRPITYPGTLAKLREVKSDLDQNNAWVMQGVNEFTALVRDGRKAGSDMLAICLQNGSFIDEEIRIECADNQTR